MYHWSERRAGRRYYSPADGQSGSQSDGDVKNGNQTDSENKDKDNDQSDGGSTKTAGGKEDSKTSDTDTNKPKLSELLKSNKDLQVEIDKLISDRLERESKKKDQDALRAKGDWENLSKQQLDEISLLKREAEAHLPIAQERDELRTLLNTRINNEIKEWPNEIKELDPGMEDLSARIRWVDKSQNLVKSLKNAKQAPNGEGGKGNENQDKKIPDGASRTLSGYSPPVR